MPPDLRTTILTSYRHIASCKEQTVFFFYNWWTLQCPQMDLNIYLRSNATDIEKHQKHIIIISNVPLCRPIIDLLWFWNKLVIHPTSHNEPLSLCTVTDASKFSCCARLGISWGLVNTDRMFFLKIIADPFTVTDTSQVTDTSISAYFTMEQQVRQFNMP